jgi:hypothetical protein
MSSLPIAALGAFSAAKKDDGTGCALANRTAIAYLVAAAMDPEQILESLPVSHSDDDETPPAPPFEAPLAGTRSSPAVGLVHRRSRVMLMSGGVRTVTPIQSAALMST